MVVDFIMDKLDEARDFITGMFDDMGEFSTTGLAVGLLSMGIIFVFRERMLYSFLQYMGTVEKIFWGGMTYIATGAVGYLIGKRIAEG